jgi:hypothetical protein
MDTQLLLCKFVDNSKKSIIFYLFEFTKHQIIINAIFKTCRCKMDSRVYRC